LIPSHTGYCCGTASSAKWITSAATPCHGRCFFAGVAEAECNPFFVTNLNSGIREECRVSIAKSGSNFVRPEKSTAVAILEIELLHVKI